MLLTVDISVGGLQRTTSRDVASVTAGLDQNQSRKVVLHPWSPATAIVGGSNGGGRNAVAWNDQPTSPSPTLLLFVFFPSLFRLLISRVKCCPTSSQHLSSLRLATYPFLFFGFSSFWRIIRLLLTRIFALFSGLISPRTVGLGRIHNKTRSLCLSRTYPRV